MVHEQSTHSADDNAGDSVQHSSRARSTGSRSHDSASAAVLELALIIILMAFVTFSAILFLAGSTGSADADAHRAMTVVSDGVVVTPLTGMATATVIAPGGVNVRIGPGVQYPILMIAPLGARSEIVGVSRDGNWWAVRVPGAPLDHGWVADEHVRAENVGGVPVLQPLPFGTTYTASRGSNDIFINYGGLEWNRSKTPTT